jgi:hypothetical protein
MTDHRSPCPADDALLPLPGADGFAIWKWACLRSAGFPAQRVRSLAMPVCAAAADRLADLVAERDRVRAEALRSVRVRLDELKDAGAWDTAERPPLVRAMSVLRRAGAGRLTDAVVPAAPQLRALDADIERARAAYAETWAQTRELTSSAIAEIASDDLFAEAVVWQNRRRITTPSCHCVGRGGPQQDPPQAGGTDRPVRAAVLHEERHVRFFGPIGGPHSRRRSGTGGQVRPGGAAGTAAIRRAVGRGRAGRRRGRAAGRAALVRPAPAAVRLPARRHTAPADRHD